MISLRGENLLVQISPQSISLTGAYSESPIPRSPDSYFYKALEIDVRVGLAASGRCTLASDLVDNSGAALVVEEANNVFTSDGYLYKRFGPGWVFLPMVTK